MYIATNDNISTNTAASGTAMSRRVSRRACAAKPDTTRAEGSPPRCSRMTNASGRTFSASPAALTQNTHCQPLAWVMREAITCPSTPAIRYAVDTAPIAVVAVRRGSASPR
ncbi:Uncharacterised protein [Mycobacteroides abscessus subsp. massiliense]|nr:Uncharacterised protein [Mycobacteroides abscessus subsp. massiliense]